MGEVIETLPAHGSSFAAPIVFIVVVAFQFLSRWLEQLKKGGVKTLKLGESMTLKFNFPSFFSPLSRPSRLLYRIYLNVSTPSFSPLYLSNFLSVLTYIVLVCWFWRVPVASLSQQLVQPLGKVISWRAGGVVNEIVMVGIIPWLILSTRVSKFVCRLAKPSTFAQAAKLRRMAAAKEKELANYQELHSKEIKLSYDLYLRILFILKVMTYIVLVCWFWRVPVASISQQLVQPFGKVISWRAGGVVNENVMVGIIPWLILSTRVSKFVCRLAKF